MQNNETNTLEYLAKAIRQKNQTDVEIARIIKRPAERGHAGEYIASILFSIELEQSASNKGIDGHFTSGNLAGKTVNIKWYGKWESILDVSPENGPDYYLVMSGPKSRSLSSIGDSRPWLVSYVFLFDSIKLLQDLKNVKLGVATSVKKQLWETAEIYPTQRNVQLILLDGQRNLIKLFGEG